MSIYEELGVDPNKKEVREIFGAVIDNEHPGAFVNIITDPYSSDRALTMHQDGDGSKFIQRLLHYFESGQEEIFLGMVDDALSMNTGDIAAAGFVLGPWVITDVINSGLDKEIKKLVMKAVAVRMTELKELYRRHGFDIKFLGGETADLRYQVRSAVFDIAITAWADKKDLITGNVKVSDQIFGFRSDGQASWEKTKNSGLMSNGLTLARKCLMHSRYNRVYPSLRGVDDFYQGCFNYDDTLPFLDAPVSESALSPTRQWAIVIKQLIINLKATDSLHLPHGITMNTGGGATKISHLGKGGILYVKEMPPPPAIFALINKMSDEKWRDMYQGFNCGIGLDIVGEKNQILVDAIKRASEFCQVDFAHLGECQSLPVGQPNKVSLHTKFGDFEY